MSAWILRLVLAASCVLALAASGRASAVQSVRDGGRDSEHSNGTGRCLSR